MAPPSRSSYAGDVSAALLESTMADRLWLLVALSSPWASVGLGFWIRSRFSAAPERRGVAAGAALGWAAGQVSYGVLRWTWDDDAASSSIGHGIFFGLAMVVWLLVMPAVRAAVRLDGVRGLALSPGIGAALAVVCLVATTGAWPGIVSVYPVSMAAWMGGLAGLAAHALQQLHGTPEASS